MKEKNIFIGILVVALVAIGAIAYRSSTMKTESPELIAPSDLVPTTPEGAAPVVVRVVRYSATGFSPTPITVGVGAMVTFINESAVDMWPASAPHPTHTDYPEFDAKKPIKPGESYSFTFTQAGTWKYHNHVNASQYGAVVVNP